MTPRPRRTLADQARMVPVVAAAWATATATTMTDAAPVVALAAWAVALVVLAVLALHARDPARRPPSRVVALLLVALTASGAVASHVAVAAPARAHLAAVAVDGGRAIEVVATVVGKVERRADGALAFDALVTGIRVGGERYDIRGEASVRADPTDVDAPPGALDVGSTIVVRGAAAATDPGERAVIEVRAGRGVEVIAPASGALGVVADLRQRLVAATDGLPGSGAGLVPGLAVGDTSAVEPELDAAMKRSSLSHLTAVSGANCALVVGLSFLAAAGLGAGRRTRVVVGLATLAGFVLLVTPEPSVVRAATMAAIAMLGLLLGRTGIGMAVLSLAVVLLLIADPWLAGSLGFALSAAATASLLLFARPFADGLSRWMPRSLALLLSVPLAAQLACGPLLVLIEPSVPLYGVLANLLAAPAAPVATIVGLSACLSAPFPWVQSGLTAIAWLPATWIATTAEVTTTLPGDLVPWTEGWLGAGALAVLGIAIGVVVAVRRGRSLRRRAVRAASIVLLAVVIGVAAGNAATRTVAGGWTLPADWSVLACDVGQGDAVLLRSAGAVALVDTGPEPAPLDACLARTGIGRVDLMVLSHFDIDHVGGAGVLLGRVGTLVHGPVTDAADERLLADFASHGAQLVEGSTGVGGALGDATWRVLWPSAGSRAFPGGNDASIVLDVRGGGVPATLLLGDLSASPQRAVAASGELAPPYAVVKIAHHGSADQHPALYALSDPSIALVTVGAENRYGHPRREILDVLAVLGVATARTDTQGVVAISLRDETASVWRERGG